MAFAWLLDEVDKADRRIDSRDLEAVFQRNGKTPESWERCVGIGGTVGIKLSGTLDGRREEDFR
jgi:hypothetical protein